MPHRKHQNKKLAFHSLPKSDLRSSPLDRRNSLVSRQSKKYKMYKGGSVKNW